jgi:hypothetical protein
MSVTLDDPFESSGGMNPDVIAVAEDHKVGFRAKDVGSGESIE